MPANCIHHPAPGPEAGTTVRETAFAGAIVVAAVAAYAPAWDVPFLFDDLPSIVENPTIRRLWPLSDALSPPAEGGFTVSGRPFLNLSLAFNYAISGLEVWSYHAGNLLIHVLAGLTLFGLVRRTCALPPLAVSHGAHADRVAFAIALVWTVHPLQTESVTYVVQRAESLMGLCFLLTLYAFVRATTTTRPRRWQVVSFVVCLLGVATKEVTALAPIMAFLYDRTFVSGSFVAAWRRHRWHHLALASTWLPLAWLVAGTGGNRGGTVGFDVGLPWTAYWLTQFEAFTRYLMLSFWPHPLIFDYGKVSAGAAATVLLWAVPVVTLFGWVLVAAHRRPVVGFCGAWFFGILAPTSLVPGALQMIVEHRMYLPLAAVLALVLGYAAARLRPRAFLALTGILTLAATLITVRRNADYASPQTMWEVTVAARPTNARAHNNLGRYLYEQGRWLEALERFRESRRLDPTIAHTHYNLGLALIQTGQHEEARAALTEATRILPAQPAYRVQLGVVLTKLGRGGEALPHFAAALRLDPSSAEAHVQVGVTLEQLGRTDEALIHYAEAVRLNPTHARAHGYWGAALFHSGDAPEAIAHLEQALALQPDLGDSHFNLGLALASQGRLAEASAHYADAVRLRPEFLDARLNLGITLGQQGDLAGAIDHLEAAVRLQPDHVEARYNLGYALFLAGRLAEARTQFEAALQQKPDHAAARETLRQLSPAAGQ